MKKKITSIFFVIALIFALKNYSNAASAGIQCNNTATVNKPISITVTGSAVQWNLTLKVNGVKIATSSEFENVQGNKNISFSGSYTPTSTGNLTVSLEGSATEASDGSTVRSFGTKTIVVSESPSNTNNSNSGTSSTKPTSPTTTTLVAKSSVATLSNLGITPNDFSGFSASKTTYSTEVPNDIESVEIYAKKGQSGQTISGTGKKTLKEGTNTFSIVVTAEDGKTKKTYTLNITRKAKEENTTSEENQTTETNEISPEETEDPTAQAFGLTELTISGIELKPQFKTDVYEYTVDLKSDLNILDIKALATEEKANIEITGNENLQDGENIITITVKGDGEDKNAIYKIIVNKEITKEKTLSNNKETLTYIIIIVAVVAIILIVLIALIIKKIKNKDTLSIPYQDINDNEEDNIEENSLEENNEQIDETEDIEEIKPKKKSSKGKRFK